MSLNIAGIWSGMGSEQVSPHPMRLEGIGGLILPGGESTAMRLLIASSGLRDAVHGAYTERSPRLGYVCGGHTPSPRRQSWESMDVQVERNAYGPQLYSRVEKGRSILSDREFSMVFIRAPRICSIPAKCESLAEIHGDFVAVRGNNILITTFHPELTDDSPFTGYFLKIDE